MPGISQDMPGIYFALLLTQCVNNSVSYELIEWHVIAYPMLPLPLSIQFFMLFVSSSGNILTTEPLHRLDAWKIKKVAALKKLFS